MTVKQNHLTHARHNVEACDFLKGTNEFNDWVITTAFYAAIHFAKYELFPKKYANHRTGKIVSFKDFDHYFRLINHRLANKHKVLQQLVENNWPEN